MKITLGTLKDMGDELATFLEPRVGAKPTASGDAIEIDDEAVRKGVKPRHVKTYIKRFLFMKGVRKKYRVFVQGRELTVQEIELKEEEEEEKAAKEEKPKEPEAAKEEAAPEPKKEEKPKKAPAKKPKAKKKPEAES